VTCPDAVTYLEYCQLTGTDPAAAETDEVRVRALIAAVTRGLELSCNCHFVQREYTEEHIMPYAPMPYPRLSWDPVPVPHELILKQRPVQAVTEIKDLAGTVIPPQEYHLFPESALLYNPSGWWPPTGGWLITVTGGHFPSTAEVAADVKQAVASLVKEGYDTPGQTAPVTSESVGPVRVTYAQPTSSTMMAPAVGFAALPPQVQVWLQPYVNLGGLGW
jgi:hypothetical protein